MSSEHHISILLPLASACEQVPGMPRRQVQVLRALGQLEQQIGTGEVLDGTLEAFVSVIATLAENGVVEAIDLSLSKLSRHMAVLEAMRTAIKTGAPMPASLESGTMTVEDAEQAAHWAGPGGRA